VIGEVKDYGGHRDAMNPKGVNLKDVWTDIPCFAIGSLSPRTEEQMLSQLRFSIAYRNVDSARDLVLDPFGGAERRNCL